MNLLDSSQKLYHTRFSYITHACYLLTIINNPHPMRLDPGYMHFISREELRILSAIEIGMRNHEYVAAELIARIGNLKGGETFKTIQKLLKNKLIVHIGNKCNGYKLTYLGYDYLALHTFMKRGLIKEVIAKIGVGKESDIYKCKTPEGDLIVLKLTRLGRNSFRSVKKNREYIQHRTNYNWLYLSRLSSIRQFLFMQLLYKHQFPVPKPIDTNRHAILMSLVDGDALCHIQRISTQRQIKSIFETTLNTLVNFSRHGLIHGDFNQFNLMVNQDGTKLTVIDFPQCISVKHPNAKSYFDRDVECIYKYFDKLAQKSYHQNVKNSEANQIQEERFKVQEYPIPQLQEIEQVKRLDHQIKLIGHITLEEYNELQKYRSEEERMRAEMEQFKEQYESGSEEEENQEQSQEELEKQKKQMYLYEQTNQIEGNEEMNKIQEILGKQGIKYEDEELKDLIDDFEEKIQGNQEEDSSSEEEERFKGLTPYEIRMKIKEQKRVEREKKKIALTTDQFIKKSLKKGKHYKPAPAKGNHGNKDKVKQTKMEIRDNLF